MPVVPRARLGADPSDFRDRVQTSAARPGFHAVGIAGMQTAEQQCLITGAHRGIAFELVRQLLQRGDRVFAGERNPEKALALYALLATQMDRMTILKLDVTNPAHIRACADRVAEQVAGLDILINNAGINYNTTEAGGCGSGKERFGVGVHLFRQQSGAKHAHTGPSV